MGGLVLGTLFVSLAGVDARPEHPNTIFYASWSLDADGDGLEDALEERLPTLDGLVLLFVHYGKRPTEDDAAVLRTGFGATRTYVFHNWDTIQVEVPARNVEALRRAPGVVAVEQLLPALPELNISVPALRVREAAGIPVEDGIDHSLGVHEDLGFRGEGMVMAILDTGINNLHESLDDLDDDPLTFDPKLVQRTDALGLPVFAGVDVSTAFAVVGCIDPQDDAGHGSHVAGIALGTGGAAGVVKGVAPKARLVDVDISVQGMGPGSGYAVGFDWIIDFNAGTTCYGPPGEDRIDVASISYSFGNSNPDAFVNVAFTDVVRSGITFTVSAGNSGPNPMTLTKGPEGAIMVANVEDRGTISRSQDRLSCSSSRGPRQGDGDLDTLDEMRPDIAAPGTSIASVSYSSVNGYTSLSGTSMAAPHVGGIATLMLQADPSLRPVDQGSNDAMGDAGAVPIRDLLQQTAQYKTTVNTASCGTPGTFTGRFGLPWNAAWGYGEADAYAAVQAALS